MSCLLGPRPPPPSAATFCLLAAQSPAGDRMSHRPLGFPSHSHFQKRREHPERPHAAPAHVTRRGPLGCGCASVGKPGDGPAGRGRCPQGRPQRQPGTWGSAWAATQARAPGSGLRGVTGNSTRRGRVSVLSLVSNRCLSCQQLSTISPMFPVTPGSLLLPPPHTHTDKAGAACVWRAHCRQRSTPFDEAGSPGPEHVLANARSELAPFRGFVVPMSAASAEGTGALPCMEMT